MYQIKRVNYFAQNIETRSGNRFNWYVDSVSGNDGNNGRSPSTAFATLSKLLTVLVAGETVGLARGSAWREDLSITKDNCSIIAYGTGNHPLIDASEIILASSWSLTGGTTNVYQAILTSNTIGVSSFVGIWENDVHLICVTSIVLCDATPGSYCVSSHVTSPFTMYVHTSNSDNPAINGKVYEYTKRGGFSSINASYVTVNGIRTRRGIGLSGNLVGGPFNRILNCISEDGSKHSMDAWTGSYIYNHIARNSYYTLEGGNKVICSWNAQIPNGEGVIFENCAVSQPSYDSECTAFSGHAGGIGTYGLIQLINCTSENCAAFNGGAHFTGLTITNCSWKNNGGIAAAIVGTLYTINNCSNIIGANALDRFVDVSAINTVVINNCTFNNKNCQNGAIRISEAATVTVTNTHISSIAGGTDNNGMVFVTHAGATVNINNCHFINNASTPEFIVFDSVTGTMAIDYNQYNTGTALWIYNADWYPSLAAWQAGTGQDSHSTVI